MGRPRARIDPEEVRKLAAIGCTLAEVGAQFGVSASTICRRFAREMELGAADCKMSLRRHQWKAVERGSVPMMIHLGKQHLDQTDKHEHTFPDSDPDATIAEARAVIAELDRAGTLERAHRNGRGPHVDVP